MDTHCKCEENYEYHELVDCISYALDARDPYTGNHSHRVAIWRVCCADILE